MTLLGNLVMNFVYRIYTNLKRTFFPKEKKKGPKINWIEKQNSVRGVGNSLPSDASSPSQGGNGACFLEACCGFIL